MKPLSVKELEKALGAINGDPEFFAKERAKEIAALEKELVYKDSKFIPVRQFNYIK